MWHSKKHCNDSMLSNYEAMHAVAFLRPKTHITDNDNEHKILLNGTFKGSNINQINMPCTVFVAYMSFSYELTVLNNWTAMILS